MFADALLSLIALTLLACLFYGPWQDLCTDWARQIVFEKRDAIFDLARAGHLDFKSKDYRIIRTSLERDIRFAHELTWLRFGAFSHLVRRRRLEQESELYQAIGRIRDDATREKVKLLVNEALLAMIVMMFCKSAVLIIAGIIIYVFGMTSTTIKRCIRIVAPIIQLAAEKSPTEIRRKPARA